VRSVLCIILMHHSQSAFDNTKRSGRLPPASESPADRVLAEKTGVDLAGVFT
jgi:hypothetical protein